MLGLAGRFVGSRSGSFAPILVLSMIPIITAIGFSVDYTSAVQTRSNMQAALDAAILSITTMDTASTIPQRQVVLQNAFNANFDGGQGTVTLNNFVVDAGGTATAQATAAFAMPTVFMQIARITNVPITVASAVSKTPALVATTFKVDKVSGWWNKVMTVYGTQFGATVAKPLMTISYTYNGAGDPKGYGTTTVSTITNNGGVDVSTVVQSQVCSTAQVNDFNSVPAGAITQTSGSKKYLTTCTNTMYPANSAGASIDVSQMGGLYLNMNVPSGNPQNLRTDDPTTSNRLYIDGTEVATGQKVDIFTAVPCGQPSSQAWEDGGSAVPTTTAVGTTQADFFYTVTGKCDFNKRPSETLLTQ